MEEKGNSIHEHPICFVIGLLMYEPVHFASLFLAYGALLISYNTWFYFLSGNKPDSYRKRHVEVLTS
ncbi:MAG: hypothetical protein FD168_277 [Desulfobulbaceae bacterium]|jgi:hypothetical protein|nr:MAG: hypothetical protein FD168_277 [Desulfobulbaceae bacterium]